MAEPLKNSYGPDIPERIGRMIGAVWSEFDNDTFLAASLSGYEALELTERARQIAAALAQTLPADRRKALDILVRSLGAEIEESELTGLGSFLYMPHSYFVAEHGLDHFEAAMVAQYEITKRFTSEFSIRAYLEHHEAATLERLREWTADTNPHVRRLVSEGTRTRLPWAGRLKRFQADPTPVFDLLELLQDDGEEYVRRSVANNLNDLSKDHPERVVDVTGRWWPEPGAEGDAAHHKRRMIRHALRTLVKQGHEGALAVLGYGPDSPARVSRVDLDPPRAEIGGKVRIEITIENPSDEPVGALVDYRVHFVKANGSTSPKVFKGAELELEARGAGTVRKTVSLKQHTTRTHYPGTHAVDVMINGRVEPGGSFELG